MCNEKEFHQGETLKMKDCFFDAKLTAVSWQLPKQVVVLGLVSDPVRPDAEGAVEFRVEAGNAAYGKGEQFRLSPDHAFALYERLCL